MPKRILVRKGFFSSTKSFTFIQILFKVQLIFVVSELEHLCKMLLIFINDRISH